MPKHLEREIEILKKRVLSLSATVEDNVYKAVRALADRLARMEATGVALDRDALRALDREFGAEIARLEAEIYADVGHQFKLGSPKQLEQVLFFELNLPKGRKTKTGYSTDATVLEELRAAHPMVDKLLDWRTYTKLRSTYVEALPSLLASDGRLHTTFHQAVAATGRLSSSDPNLQNIPIRTPLGRRIRHAFVAGSPGTTLVAADYSQILGVRTDLGIGLAGGGFADSYSEIRGGKYLEEESFVGHGAELDLSVYHRFNPDGLIPLNGVFRIFGRYSAFNEESDTADDFEVPDDMGRFGLRTGLRWGGREPVLFPSLAMEISAWYEGEFRTQDDVYGYGDREVETCTHSYWLQALLAYTIPECEHQFYLSVTLGGSVTPDRFSAYRLGALLPLYGRRYQNTGPGRVCLCDLQPGIGQRLLGRGHSQLLETVTPPGLLCLHVPFRIEVFHLACTMYI